MHKNRKKRSNEHRIYEHVGGPDFDFFRKDFISKSRNFMAFYRSEAL